MRKNWVIHFLFQLFEPPTRLFVEAKYISVDNLNPIQARLFTGKFLEEPGVKLIPP